MKDTDETAFLNSLFMDFTSENELELFLKSLDEVWSEDLYSRLSAAGLIRHVISKVWNKEQHRISMVFEYDSKEGYQKRQEIIDKEFGVTLKEKIKKFVFKYITIEELWYLNLLGLLTKMSDVYLKTMLGGTMQKAYLILRRYEYKSI